MCSSKEGLCPGDAGPTAFIRLVWARVIGLSPGKGEEMESVCSYGLKATCLLDNAEITAQSADNTREKGARVKHLKVTKVDIFQGSPL